VYILGLYGIDGTYDKMSIFLQRSNIMIYYEAFQTKEGKILYALFIVITLILFVIDRFIDKKKKKDI
jgi:hypothetical protein